MDAESLEARMMNSSVHAHVVFRVDASIQIGTGHVMRCLTLADALHAQGAHCTFICRPHKGHLLDEITKHGHVAVALPTLGTATISFSTDPAHAAWLGTDWLTDAKDTLQALGNQPIDWLVVDHYALDQLWEQALRPYCQNLMAIDDLADRPHDCDVLLDQNLGRSAKDYAGLLMPKTFTLIGPQYALLRPEFAQLRSQSLARRVNAQLKRLLVTMGGVDKDNVTGQVLQLLNACKLPHDFTITVIMGSYSPCLAAVQEQAMKMVRPTQVQIAVNNMAQIMAGSDLAIGAAGSTSWERCCMGLPSIQLVLAENQRAAADALASMHAAIGFNQSLKWTNDFKGLFEKIDFKKLSDLSLRSAEICDGTGSQLVCKFIMTHND
jgi:UDP-2,4-diacetamido-2,4,6-trideoxy-beta-L-altropyranose hydrolase